MAEKKIGVESRNEVFVTRTATNIWEEQPSEDNPYLAKTRRCYGYDIEELAAKRSFIDVLYLLFMGELPTPEKSRLFEQLMIIYINPGPRHPATQAAMNAGISRVNYENILPISLSIQGGAHLGGREVEHAMRFLQAQIDRSPDVVAQQLKEKNTAPKEGDWHICPGFGTHYGSIDAAQYQIVERFSKLSGRGAFLEWGRCFASALAEIEVGWLSTGVVAAVLCDLGFPPRAGAGLFQLISAPGLLAHGLEMSTKPLTSMPFLDDKNYVISGI